MATGEDDRDRVRASDGEREEYAKWVRAAMSEGRLTLDEGEQRLAGVYAARFRDELPPFTRDLPGAGAPGTPPGPEAAPDSEKARRHARRHLFCHGSSLAATAVILIGLWAVTGAHAFWPALPLLVLTLVFVRHLRYRRWLRWHGVPGPWEHHHGPWGHHGPWARGPWGPRGPWEHHGPWGHGGADDPAAPGAPGTAGAHGHGREAGWYR